MNPKADAAIKVEPTTMRSARAAAVMTPTELQQLRQLVVLTIGGLS
jgi:hypothetical protein